MDGGDLDMITSKREILRILRAQERRIRSLELFVAGLAIAAGVAAGVVVGSVLTTALLLL